MIRLKKLIIILGIIILSLILSGCGGNIKTSIKLNENLSGERVMQVYFDKIENAGYIKGDAKDITAMIKKSVPKQLEFKSEETESGYTYYFTMKFNSLEEYDSKVEALLGKNGNIAEIKFHQASSPFVKGILYEENFRSEQILKWMEDLLFDAGYVDSQYKSQGIFRNEDAQLFYKGQLVSKEEDIYSLNLSTLEFYPIEAIDVLTKYNDDFTITRSISVILPMSTYNAKAKEIDAFLKERTIEGAKTNVETVEGFHVYTITLENATESQIDEMVNKFTNGGSSFTIKDKVNEEIQTNLTVREETNENSKTADKKEEVEDKTKENVENKAEAKDNETKGHTEAKEEAHYMNAFILDKEIEDKWNLTDYIKDYYNRIDLSYYVNNEIKNTDILVKDHPMKSLQKSDYYKGYSLLESKKYATDSTFKYRIKKSYQIEDLKINSILDKKGNIHYDTLFRFSDKISENEFNALKSKIEKQIAYTTVNLKRIEHTENGFEIELSEDIEYIGEHLNNINWMWLVSDSFVAPNIIVEDRGLFKQHITYEENIFLRSFSDKPIKNFEYRLSNIGYIEEIYSEYEGVKEGKDYVIRITDYKEEGNHYFTFYVRSERNTGGIILIAIGILALALVIFAIIVLSKKKKQKVKAIENVEIVVDEGAITTENISEESKNDIVEANDVEIVKEKSTSDTSEEATTEIVAGTTVEESATRGSEKEESDSITTFCINCGSKLDKDAKFCSNCGAVVK